MNELEKHYAKWKKVDTKDYMLHSTIYMEYTNKAHLLTQKVDELLPGTGWVWDMITNEHEGPFGGARNIVKLDRGDVCTTLLTFLKKYWIVYLKQENFMIYKCISINLF